MNEQEGRGRAMSSNAEIFLDDYRKLEDIIRNKYHLENWESAMNYLEKRTEFKEIASELRYCREVRNLLSHKPKVRQEYSVEPSDEMVKLLEDMIRQLEQAPVIMDLAVPSARILSKSYENNVIATLRQMNDRSFGNVPIMEKGIVKGVLSEKAIVNYLVREEKFHISDKLCLKDIRDYLLLENHQKECYRFVKKDALISDVSALFHQAIDQGYRIGMVFITEHGRSDERVLGIVTAWDLAGRV